MLVCNVSQRARRAAIAADIAETAAATDALGTGNIVFATLVDDPASVGEVVDAYLGEIMIEAASAGDTLDASAGAIISANVAEVAAADSTQNGTLAVTTSYANAGGTGDRTSTITVTTTATLGGGTISQLVDGSQANGLWWTSGQSLITVTFDFGVGASKVIDEFKWYQSAVTVHGLWVFEGSNDNSSYTTFPESIDLGDIATDVVPVTNTSGYRYYRLRQYNNVTSSGPYLREIEFKIG
jgi:hypothetical protein